MAHLSRRSFLLGSMGAAALALAPKALVPAEAPFPEGWTIVEETIDPGLYGDIAQRYSKALARSMLQTREIVARNVLEKAFEPEYEHVTYGTARIYELDE